MGAATKKKKKTRLSGLKAGLVYASTLRLKPGLVYAGLDQAWFTPSSNQVQRHANWLRSTQNHVGLTRNGTRLERQHTFRAGLFTRSA
jgi:hypothetical protein